MDSDDLLQSVFEHLHAFEADLKTFSTTEQRKNERIQNGILQRLKALESSQFRDSQPIHPFPNSHTSPLPPNSNKKQRRSRPSLSIIPDASHPHPIPNAPQISDIPQRTPPSSPNHSLPLASHPNTQRRLLQGLVGPLQSAQEMDMDLDIDQLASPSLLSFRNRRPQNSNKTNSLPKNKKRRARKRIVSSMAMDEGEGEENGEARASPPPSPLLVIDETSQKTVEPPPSHQKATVLSLDVQNALDNAQGKSSTLHT